VDLYWLEVAPGTAMETSSKVKLRSDSSLWGRSAEATNVWTPLNLNHRCEWSCPGAEAWLWSLNWEETRTYLAISYLERSTGMCLKWLPSKVHTARLWPRGGKMSSLLIGGLSERRAPLPMMQ
jgi:hypothetical protein